MDVVLEPGLKVLFKSGLFVYNGLRGSDCKKFQQSVDSLLPIVTEICSSSSESSLKLSLQKFQEFRENLDKGIQLVEDHKRSHLLDPRRVKINESVKKLEKSIIEFIQKDLQVVMASAQIYLSTQLETVLGLQHEMVNAQVNLSEGMEAVCERVQAVHRAVVTLGEAVESGVQTGTQIMVETIHQVENNLMSKFEEQRRLCNPPDTPNGFLGFGKHTMNLKKFLLEDGVNVVAVTAMGGAGKSTLAAAVCNDNEIKEYFKEKVIYIEVSESPDLLTILKTMWRKIVGAPTPDFTNVENAHTEMQLKIKSRNQPNQPILVVLDDIWKKPHLEKLLFEEKQYKTLVTTRDEAVIIKELRTRIYKLQSLQPQYALSLFCHYAFGKTSIPIGRDKKLIEKVQQECNGLPLALKVIGRSLYDESDSVWELAERRLSAGEPIKDDHKESLLNRLETSIHVLDDNEKQCFLDLGAFPQRKTIPAKALLDIWVYVRGMKSVQADTLLRKFANRHLLDLKKNHGTAEITDDFMDGYSFSQHDVMRDLALYLASQDNNGRRLYMPKMKNHLPSEWEGLSCKAHIVSIHTGTMEDTQWPKMEFPKVKVLVLYSTASEYCIPTFLHTMKKLKVLIINNSDGAKRSKLSGVADFQELSQLKSLHLERLVVPEECKVLKSLEKIYMSLCEGLGRDKTFNFPGLLEFNVSYCSDLEELPGLCSSDYLKKLSVTHCHRLAKLPDEIGSLKSLKKIRLCESAGLKALPSSICDLKKLKILDISSCIHLKVKSGGQCELKKTLQTVAKLPSLERLICDVKIEQLFKRTIGTEHKVRGVVEEEPNLDWLDLERN